MSFTTVILTVAAILIAVILTVVLGGGYGFFVYSIKRRMPGIDPEKINNPRDPWVMMKPVMDEGKAWINSHKLETVEIHSYDGLKLVGHFFPAGEKTDKTMLMMHGYRSRDFNDFCRSAKYFHEFGYNILFADQRSHGESEGKYICFGIRERHDCLGWVNFLVNRFGEDSTIFLMGVSMGAATVTMALGFDLPKAVKGCVSDCGFTSPKAIFKHVLRHDYHLPDFPFIYTQDFACKKFAGFGIDEYSSLSALRNNKIPVLFIHGGKDTFVPLWMTMRNYEVCAGPKELLIVDEATHAQSFLVDPEKCWAAMKAFVEKYQ